MSEYPGKNSNGKIIKYNLRSYEGQLNLYELDRRDTSALIASILPLDWLKRHDSLPDDLNTQDKLSAFADRLRLRLMTVIAFCERMIDCFENDADVKAALAALIAQIIAENPEVQEVIREVSRIGERYIPGSVEGNSGINTPDCNTDVAAGFIKDGVVIRSIDLINDWFSAMALAGTDEQIVDTLLEAIPVLGALGDAFSVTNIVQLKDNIVAWIKNAFEAEDTVTRREQTYRDLLCLWEQNGCKLSMLDIREYFWQKATGANSGFNEALGTAVDMFNFLTGNETSFPGIWYVMHAVQFGLGYHLGWMIGMSFDEFQLRTNLGDPTDDWITWYALYGACLCAIIYKKPDNPIDNLTCEPGYGLIGIAETLAVSTNDSGTAWIVTETEPELIEVTDAKGFRIIVDTEDKIEYQIYCDTTLFASDGTGGTTNSFQTFWKEGKWMTDIRLSTPFTGFIQTFNMRKAIGVTSNFKWLEFHVLVDC